MIATKFAHWLSDARTPAHEDAYPVRFIPLGLVLAQPRLAVASLGSPFIARSTLHAVQLMRI